MAAKHRNIEIEAEGAINTLEPLTDSINRGDEIANASLPNFNSKYQIPEGFVWASQLFDDRRKEIESGLRCPCPHPHRVGDSVLEERFWHMMLKTSGGFHGSADQFQIGRYRVDAIFDCGGEVVVIELDGKAYHDRAADTERDNILINSVDAIIRIPFAAMWYYRNATLAAIASWYPRFDAGYYVTCLPLSEFNQEYTDIKAEREWNPQEWIAEVEHSYDIWEAGRQYATVGSPKGFLGQTMNRHVITRQLGRAAPGIRDRIYAESKCNADAVISKDAISVSRFADNR